MVEQVRPHGDIRQKDDGGAELPNRDRAYSSFHDEVTRDRQNLFIADLAERRSYSSVQKKDEHDDVDRASTKMKGEEGSGSKPGADHHHGPTTKMVGEDGTAGRDPFTPPTSNLRGEGGTGEKAPETSNLRDEAGTGTKAPETSNLKDEAGTGTKAPPEIPPDLSNSKEEGGPIVKAPPPLPPDSSNSKEEGGPIVKAPPQLPPDSSNSKEEGGPIVKAPPQVPPDSSNSKEEGGLIQLPTSCFVDEAGPILKPIEPRPFPFPPITERFGEGGIEPKPGFEAGKPEELPTGDLLDRLSGEQRLLTGNGDVISLKQDGTYAVKGDVKSVTTTKDGVTTITLADGERVTFGKDGFKSIRKGGEAVFFVNGKTLHGHLLKDPRKPYLEKPL